MKHTELSQFQPYGLPEERAKAQEILDSQPVKPIRRVTTESLGGKERHMDMCVKRKRAVKADEGEE